MLRIIQHTDAHELFDLVQQNRSFLREWLPWLDGNTTIDHTKSFIAAALQGYANNQSQTCVIVEGGCLCGVAGFNWINHATRSAGIGYWLSKHCTGKGIMTKSCQELEHIGFKQLRLNKLEIRVAEHNRQSRRVAERLHYRQDGMIRDAEWLYDHFVDHVIYSKLAREYDPSQPG